MLVSRILGEAFMLERGITYGDSISPYIFNICTEISVKVSNDGLIIPYSIFDDDCMFF